MKVIASLIVVAVVALAVGGWWVSTSNQEIRLRNAITQKQKDNESELDSVQKKISQSAQVTQAQMSALKDIIVGNSDARATQGGSLATLVREAVPTIDTSSFKQLMNTITSSRDAFAQRQKEILALKTEHDNLRMTWPASIVVGSRASINVIVVTSARAADSFRTGQDNDISVFPSMR